MSVHNWPNPYKGSCRLDIFAPAEMLETVAGYPDDHRLERELSFALSAADPGDNTTLRWLAVLIELKLADDPSDPPSFQGDE